MKIYGDLKPNWVMKRLPAIASALILFSTLTRLDAHLSYPYWDAQSPELPPLVDRDAVGFMPFIATTDAVYTVALPPGLNQTGWIARWTECGGWESLPGLVVDAWAHGTSHTDTIMTIHDHYLYAVGFFKLAGYGPANNSDLTPESAGKYGNDVQIAKFDLNTGLWSPVGQNFTAVNVEFPTTIAIDSNNRIYVGFFLGTPGSDMLDVSSDGGATWQPVGTGLQPSPPHAGGGAGISALTADGTNVYIGGDFTGPVGMEGQSQNVVMWAGNTWRTLNGGVSPTSGLGFDYAWGADTVNSIVSIGTNIYVAGCFTSPYAALARFSNVTGQSLPTGDPATYLIWNVQNLQYQIGATSLAVNNGNLYLGGGQPFGPGGACLAVCSDPQSQTPHTWTTNVSTIYGGTINALTFDDEDWISYLAAAPNGDAVYVAGILSGQDLSGFSFGGFCHLLTAPESRSATATITGVTWQNNIDTLAISGTAGSHWQVLSSPDQTTWTTIGTITLWGGTGSFVDVNVTGHPYYKLANSCAQSAVVSSAP